MTYNYDHAPWIVTYTGKKIYPWDPKPEDIDIIDIGISLARECRFGNHTKDFYSVAQHCVLGSHLVSGPNALWFLMHDSPEAYLGDMPKPLKQMIPEFEVAHERLMRAVCERFHLPFEEPAEVKEIDRLLLASEAAFHQAYHPDNWHLELGVEPDTGLFLDAWSIEDSFTTFMTRFQELTR